MLFDAIEFSALIASGDVLYDLAFLLMDLTERGLRPAANIVLNRYLLETRPRRGSSTRSRRCRSSCRCARRSAPRSRPRGLPMPSADRTSRHREASRANISTLRGRCIAPPPPLLVAVGGLSGTGKSVLARALAPDLAPAPGAVVLRSDVERKALFGKERTEKLPADAYTPDVTARVYATLADKARRVLAAGHSAIVDAVFAKPQERMLMERSASSAGVPFRGLFLEADLATRVARVGTREHDASDADAAVARSAGKL